jgi:hypothetical protein
MNVFQSIRYRSGMTGQALACRMGFWGTLLVCQSSKPLRGELEVEQITGLPWPAWRVWGGLSVEAHDAIAATGSFAAAEVYDSDGAKVTAVSEPSGRVTAYLNLDAVAVHHFLPPSPFDAEGNEMTGAALRAQNTAYEAELAEHKRPLMASQADAAQRLVTWAAESGLAPPSIADVQRILDSTETFAEDQFFVLLEGLGLR